MTHKRSTRHALTAAAVLLMLAGLLYACAAAPAANKPAGFVDSLLRIYRGPLNHLYAIRGGQCPMYPSCSVYARQAITRHGAIVGTAMAADRLLRCGRDETHLSPPILVHGETKTYDPVSANDFWWFTDPVSAQHTRDRAEEK